MLFHDKIVPLYEVSAIVPEPPFLYRSYTLFQEFIRRAGDRACDI